MIHTPAGAQHWEHPKGLPSGVCDAEAENPIHRVEIPTVFAGTLSALHRLPTWPLEAASHPLACWIIMSSKSTVTLKGPARRLGSLGPLQVLALPQITAIIWPLKTYSLSVGVFSTQAKGAFPTGTSSLLAVSSAAPELSQSWWLCKLPVVVLTFLMSSPLCHWLRPSSHEEGRKLLGEILLCAAPMIFPSLASHSEDAGPSSFRASSLYLPVKRLGAYIFLLSFVQES